MKIDGPGSALPPKVDLGKLIRTGLIDYAGPCFLFDSSVLEARFAWMSRVAAESGCELLFPVKSFPEAAVLKLARRWFAGFDVANAGEIVSLPAAVNDRVVSITGPAVAYLSPAALKPIARARIVIVVETATQYDAVRELPGVLDVCLRLNAQTVFEAAGRANASWSRFGAERAGLLPWVRSLGRSKRFGGFHVHAGHEMTPTDYLDLARGTLRLARVLKLPVPVLNLGGGLAPLGLEEFRPLLQALRQIVPASTKLRFEPGEVLAHGTGVALGKLLSIRRSGNVWSGVADLSRELHLRWCRPQLVTKVTPGPASVQVRIFGPTCYEGDLLGEFRLPSPEHDVAPLREGDWLACANINGYCAALNHGFNGVAPASLRFIGRGELGSF